MVLGRTGTPERGYDALVPRREAGCGWHGIKRPLRGKGDGTCAGILLGRLLRCLDEVNEEQIEIGSPQQYPSQHRFPEETWVSPVWRSQKSGELQSGDQTSSAWWNPTRQKMGPGESRRNGRPIWPRGFWRQSRPTMLGSVLAGTNPCRLHDAAHCRFSAVTMMSIAWACQRWTALWSAPSAAPSRRQGNRYRSVTGCTRLRAPTMRRNT